MASGWLKQECPKCKYRNSEKAKTCMKKQEDGTLCGFNLSKYKGRVWWIEWREGLRKPKERIGPSKEAAQNRLCEVLKNLTEKRQIKKSKDAVTRFADLAQWYLNLDKVKEKKSYTRDKELVANLLHYFGDKLLKDITPALVEAYQQKRLKEASRRTPQTLTKPATVNREVACLKAIFNKAIENDKAERNPCQGKKVVMLKENNERDRVLNSNEYARLMAHCPAHLKPIVKLAYQTGMRQKEILFLTWGQVDLKEGFIRLRPEDTKTNEARDVPLSPELIEMFKAMPRGLPTVRVFPYKGKAFGSTFQRAFETARKRAGIEDFTFHDLRHTFVTNMDRAGVPQTVIMKITGHKTLAMFKRYRAVSRDEMQEAVKKIGRVGAQIGAHANLEPSQKALTT